MYEQNEEYSSFTLFSGDFEAMQRKTRFRWRYPLIILGFAGLHFMAYTKVGSVMFYCGWFSGTVCDLKGKVITSLAEFFFYVLMSPTILLFPFLSNVPNVIGIAALILTDFLWGCMLFLVSYRIVDWIAERKRVHSLKSKMHDEP